MIAAARTAIYVQLKGVTDLSASNVHFQEAPQAIADPYCVFMETGSPSEHDTGDYFDTIFFQAAVYSKTLATIETIIANIKAAFDTAALSISGYDFDGISRVATLTRPQDEEGWYMMLVEYQIFLASTPDAVPVLFENLTLIKM